MAEWEDISIRPNMTWGDKDSRDTYAGVGIALSRWENMEFGLAVLYSQFSKKPHNIELMQEYGVSGRIFFDRLSALERLAETYFIKAPHQKVEGIFAKICGTARKLSVRRNEIAHGIVADIHVSVDDNDEPIEDGRLSKRYFLAPPFHQYLKYDGDDRYYYCSKNLEHWSKMFDILHAKVSEFQGYLEHIHGRKDLIG